MFDEHDEETAQADEVGGGATPATEELQQAAQAETPQPTESPEAAKTSPPAPPAPTPDPQPEASPQPQTAVKLVSFNDIVSAVRDAIWAIYDNINAGLPESERAWVSAVRVYDGFGVVTVGLQHWRFAYTLENGRAVLPPKNEWQAVEPDWVLKTIDDATVVYPGAAVKAIGDKDDGWIGGYLVHFTDADHPDLVGDFFDEDTDYGPHGKSLVWFNHGLDETLQLRALGAKSDGRFAEADIKADTVGVWIQMQLDMRDEYERALYHMAKSAKVGWSSGTATHLVKRTLVSGKAYHIDTWPLGLDASITPTPAAGPALTAVTPLKSYRQTAGNVSIKSLMAGLDIPDARKEPPSFLEELKTMDPEELIAKFGAMVDEKLKPIADQVGEQAKTLDAFKAAPATNKLPQGEAPEGDGSNGGGDSMKAVAQSVYLQQFGKPDAAMKAVMTDLIGPEYEHAIYVKTQAFAKWVRNGTSRLTKTEEKLLYQQFFSPTDIKNFIFDAGLSVSEIKDRMARSEASLSGIPLPPQIQERFAQKMGGMKDTMFTGSGQLGGYAIAPMRDDIAARLPGNTVVRAGGARVVDLINATSIEVPVYSGGDDRYRGAIRGSWGGEKTSSPETNATTELDTVAAHPYTFKVPVTRSLLMNAGNLIDMLTRDIVDTAAIDEDEAFLIGDGTGGQPLGIIPGGARLDTLGLGYVQHTSMTADKLIELSDDLDDQYTDGAMFVFKKATGTAIRQLKDTTNQYLFRAGLDAGAPTTLMGHMYRRSQAMPAVAAGSCPILFGNMGGYLIVQEPGMTIERFQDSGTGLGKVEFHVWRMLGGRVIYPWMFSVLEITS